MRPLQASLDIDQASPAQPHAGTSELAWGAPVLGQASGPAHLLSNMNRAARPELENGGESLELGADLDV